MTGSLRWRGVCFLGDGDGDMGGGVGRHLIVPRTRRLGCHNAYHTASAVCASGFTFENDVIADHDNKYSKYEATLGKT